MDEPYHKSIWISLTGKVTTFENKEMNAAIKWLSE